MYDTMKSPKSELYCELLVRVLRDTASSCHLADLDTAKDIEYVRGRVHNHGLTFLTDVLPALGKAFDKCLAQDVSFSEVVRDTQGLNMALDASGLPQFLGGYWKLILDKHHLVANLDGDELFHQASAVRAVRQVCYLAYKLDVPYEESKVNSVLDNFVETDASLPEESEQVPLSLETRRALTSAKLLVLRVLQGFDPKAIVPAHGPGAVATGEKPWAKMAFKRFYPHLDEEYSYPEYFFYNYTHLSDELELLEDLDTLEVACAKVALVPKDSRGPRIISMEPLEIQWIQQGIGRALIKYLEHAPTPCHGMVNFTNQDVNRGLAQSSSVHSSSLKERMVTLDMKDASDRVSLWLVNQLLPLHCLRAFKACRSQQTELPGGNRIQLRKFAPMGSALCFPVESLIFWALAEGAVNTLCRFGDMKSLTPMFVYGDDLIVPYWAVSKIRAVFEEVHLRFNESKCCVGRFFRESCGLDAFQGIDVTPIRLKKQFADKLSPAAVLAYVSYVNSLRERQWYDSANYLEGRIISQFGCIPVTNVAGKYQLALYRKDWDNADCLGHNLSAFPRRYNKRLQRVEIKVPTVCTPVFMRGRPDWSELLRVHDSLSHKEDKDVEGARACRYAVPHAEKVRGVWVDVMQYLR